MVGNLDQLCFAHLATKSSFSRASHQQPDYGISLESMHLIFAGLSALDWALPND
jgi:hypothetical protein